MPRKTSLVFRCRDCLGTGTGWTGMGRMNGSGHLRDARLVQQEIDFACKWTCLVRVREILATEFARKMALSFSTTAPCLLSDWDRSVVRSRMKQDFGRNWIYNYIMIYRYVYNIIYIYTYCLILVGSEHAENTSDPGDMAGLGTLGAFHPRRIPLERQHLWLHSWQISWLSDVIPSLYLSNENFFPLR